MNNFKFCANCGKKIPKGTTFCPYCGHKQPINMINPTPKASNSSYPTRRYGNHSHSSHKVWLLVIVILVIIAGGFGFYKHKEANSLPNLLTSHPWSVKYTNLDNNQSKTDNHKTTFKHGKVYTSNRKKVFASYHVTSQNQFDMYIYQLHEHVYNHVKSSSPDKIIINKEYGKLSFAFAKRLRNYYNESPHKPHLSEYENKIMNDQVVKTHETSELIK